MKCVYCNNSVPLSRWGEHSQNCIDRKRIRSGGVSKKEVAPEVVEHDQASTLDEMTKDDLILYLEENEIEYDPKARKSKLLKLAKGE